MLLLKNHILKATILKKTLISKIAFTLRNMQKCATYKFVFSFLVYKFKTHIGISRATEKNNNNNMQMLEVMSPD